MSLKSSSLSSMTAAFVSAVGLLVLSVAQPSGADELLVSSGFESQSTPASNSQPSLPEPVLAEAPVAAPPLAEELNFPQLPSAQDNWEAVQLLQEGCSLLRQGNSERALFCFEKALQKDRGRIEILPYQAAALNDLHRPEEAQAVIEEYLRSEPDDTRAALLYAAILFNTGQMAQAEEQLQPLEATGDDLHYYLQLRGRVAVKLGHQDEAIAFFRRALTLQPASTETLLHLVAALRRAGQNQEALSLLKGAVRTPALDNALGVLYVAEREYAPAREAFAKAAAAGSEVGAVNEQIMAVSYFEDGSILMAAELSDRYPENLTAELLYDIMLYRTGRFPEAMASLAELGADFSNQSSLKQVVLQYQGLCCLALGQNAKAEQMFLPLLSQANQSPVLYHNLSVAAQRQNHYSQAFGYARQAYNLLKSDPTLSLKKRAAVILNIALLNDKLAHPSAAAKHYSQYLLLDKADTLPHRYAEQRLRVLSAL